MSRHADISRWPRPIAALTAAGCLALVVASAQGCGDSSDEQVAGPRRAVLQSLADVVIIPTYREAAARLDLFAAAAAALHQQPTADTLAAAQESWRSARHTWKQSEAFRFGPTEDLHLRIRTKVDWSPISPTRIEEQVAGTAEITPEYIDTLGTNRRGFLAIEYLLFDAGGNDVLTRLQGADGDRRRAYIAAIAADIAVQAHKLVEAWVVEGGNYRFELIAAGQESIEFESLKDAVDTVVNTAVLLSATIEENKIGRPFGIKTSGVPQPHVVETAYSDNSLVDILDNLESIENVYLGRRESHTGQGLQALVVNVSPAIDAEILDAIALAKQRIRAVPPPLEEAVHSARGAVQAALDAATDLRLTLAVDLVSALGTTPVFVGDGD